MTFHAWFRFSGFIVSVLFLMGCQSDEGRASCVACLDEYPFSRGCDEKKWNSSGEMICIVGNDVRPCLAIRDCCQQAGADIVYSQGQCLPRCRNNADCLADQFCGSDGRCESVTPMMEPTDCDTTCDALAGCEMQEAIGCNNVCRRAAEACGRENGTTVAVRVYPAEGSKHDNLLTDGSSDFLELVVV